MFAAWNFSFWLITALAGIATIVAIGHALLHKRESHAAVLWVLICLLLPFLGPLFYLLFGINRSWNRINRPAARNQPPSDSEISGNHKQKTGIEKSAHMRLGSAITGLPLVSGNKVSWLKNGEQAYPAMLDAIQQAENWIYLGTYIFEHHGIGKQFITALKDAKKRGVEVYVLLDGVGAWYSFNRTRKILRQAGVCVCTFLPPQLVPPQLEINLRNHRKTLLVDGKTGFTGGMNIRQSHLIGAAKEADATRGLMFELQGPILSQITRVFEEDWYFVTGDHLPQRKFLQTSPGSMSCRTIVDGPGVHINTLVNLLVGAFSMAEQRIAIVTPYFLPPPELVAALQAAALRGVEVMVLIPQKSNLRYVDWATRKILPGLVKYGIEVFYQPAPFDHSKLLLIDNHYSLIGSSNLDARSLRLNFELVVEIYDSEFGQQQNKHINLLKEASTAVSLEMLESKPLLKRVWYAFWWLFTPYL